MLHRAREKARQTDRQSDQRKERATEGGTEEGTKGQREQRREGGREGGRAAGKGPGDTGVRVLGAQDADWIAMFGSAGEMVCATDDRKAEAGEWRTCVEKETAGGSTPAVRQAPETTYNLIRDQERRGGGRGEEEVEMREELQEGAVAVPSAKCDRCTRGGTATKTESATRD